MDNVSIISAIGKNNEIGINNDLIWNFKNDMKFFKETTYNSNIVMGYNTFISLPKLLPNRKHLVLTHHNIKEDNNIIIFNDLNKLLEYISIDKTNTFIIGGYSLYKIFIDLVNTMYITEINDVCNNATVYFPKYNKESWNKTVLNSYKENNINYDIALYRRR